MSKKAKRKKNSQEGRTKKEEPARQNRKAESRQPAIMLEKKILVIKLGKEQRNRH